MKFKIGDKVKVIGPLRSAYDIRVGDIGVVTSSTIGTVGDYQRKPIYRIDDKISGWVGEDAIVEYGEVGTLKELGVKPGDVVECVDENCIFSWTKWNKYDVSIVDGRLYCNGVSNGIFDGSCTAKFRIISRASETLKLWCDMTPEEKGALLLAHHDGKVIEFSRPDSTPWWRKANNPPEWRDGNAYRIRPEPKVETVVNTEMYITDRGCVASNATLTGARKVKLTYKKVDGVIDLASYTLEYR